MISAIIPAAGESKRMGRPKMSLPWGNETVLTRVVSIFKNAGVEDIVVVTGGAREQVERLLANIEVRTIHNEDHARGGMLSSVQCGMRTLGRQTQAALIGLGDQPQVRERTVRMVCDAFLETKSNIVVPSFQMRRGHPWLVARPLWEQVLEMKPPQSLRDFLSARRAEIHYVNVDDPNVLADLDTPEDYEKWRSE